MMSFCRKQLPEVTLSGEVLMAVLGWVSLSPLVASLEIICTQYSVSSSSLWRSGNKATTVDLVAMFRNIVEWRVCLTLSCDLSFCDLSSVFFSLLILESAESLIAAAGLGMGSG